MMLRQLPLKNKRRTTSLQLPIDTNLVDPDLIPRVGGPPHSLFDAWRKADPVHWNPPTDSYKETMRGAVINKGFWVLTRYQDVYDVSRDQTVYSSHEGGPIIWDLNPEQLAMQRANIMGMQREQHASVRRMVLPPLSPKELQRFEPEIERKAGEIVDSIAAKGECEFVFEVASKLPVFTFCSVMGAPSEYQDILFKLGNAAADIENTVLDEQGVNPVFQLLAVANELISSKRENPDDSMLSRLVHGKVDGEGLPDDTLTMFVVTLSIAGHETTRNTAAHFIRLMNEFPEQYELLRSDVDKHLANAVEEVLRYSPPVVKFRRTALADSEIGGHKVKKGDKIYLSYPAANRDPEVFEDPHKFDITRENASKHLAFGTGPHVCLGARLARLQLAALLRQVIERIPDIHPHGEMEMLRSLWFNSIIKMPVKFTSENAS